MKRFCATAAALTMLGGFALAQGTGGTGSGGTSSPGASNPGTAASPSPSNDATVPLGTTLPGGSPAPSGSATTGQGPGTNPANSQDMLGRSNPQDMTTPRAKNPQDRSGQGAPQIMAPER